MKSNKPSRRPPRRRAKLPKIIPPRSVFRLARGDSETPNWAAEIGRVFRIGYYSRQDGLDVIWLVNEEGEYEQATDRDFLVKYFDPITISGETDLHGIGKPEFKPLKEDSRGYPSRKPYV